MFEPLDLQTPQLAIGIGLVFAVAGAAIVVHATWRACRLKAWEKGKKKRCEGTVSRGEWPNVRRDVLIETIAGLVVMIIGVGAMFFGGLSQIHQHDVLDSNVIAKY